jgi:hypothetical protein
MKCELNGIFRRDYLFCMNGFGLDRASPMLSHPSQPGHGKSPVTGAGQRPGFLQWGDEGEWSLVPFLLWTVDVVSGFPTVPVS